MNLKRGAADSVPPSAVAKGIIHLTLQGKIVCQRQVTRPSFGILPDTGNTISA